MSPTVYKLVKNNYWLKDGEWENLELYQYNDVFKIFECVFLNFAARQEVHWTKIYNAKNTDVELYADLCVASFILEEILINNF